MWSLLFTSLVLFLSVCFVFANLSPGADSQPGKSMKDPNTAEIDRSVIDLISAFQILNPELTQPPTIQPSVHSAPQKGGSTPKMLYKAKKKEILKSNLPEKSVTELQQELRLIAGQLLLQSKQALTLANLVTENVDELQKQSLKIKYKLKVIGSSQLSGEQVDQVIKAQSRRLAGVRDQAMGYPNVKGMVSTVGMVTDSATGAVGRWIGMKSAQKPGENIKPETQDHKTKLENQGATK